MKRAFLTMVALAAACSSDPANDRTLTRPDTGDDLGVEADGGRFDSDVDVSGPDVGPGSDTDMAGEPDLGNLCRPNRDGVIERDEVSLNAGLSAKFATATDVTWDTAGDASGGDVSWDLAEPFPGEQNVLIELRDPAGQWFETTFSDADYFTPLSTGSDLLGVFRVTDDAVLLLGVVSPEDGILSTELAYDPPVPVLQFPLQRGDSWSVESTVTGLYQGVISVYTETYAFEADETGSLLTPYGTFPSIRVRSVLDRQVGLLTTVIRSFAFVTECFGTVATVAAREGEQGLEFTDVAELKRLAP